MKVINEYKVCTDRYYDCDLIVNPNKKHPSTTKKFTQSNSPIVFSNVITYSVGASEQPITLDNRFYVSEITNYPKGELVETKTFAPGELPNCDGKKPLTFSFIQYYPGEFFIYYTESSKTKLHH
jgi:hypothetical protein